MYSKAFKIYQKCFYFKVYKIQTLKVEGWHMVFCRWWEKRGGGSTEDPGGESSVEGCSLPSSLVPQHPKELVWLPQEPAESWTQEPPVSERAVQCPVLWVRIKEWGLHL